mmetsp:Transcript_69859/g.204853  ORF Transcript_69859/g.204853 Transcript_69859/m.204853 type:complete len:222 (+) Transcript_69859:447-1112(+)
MLEPIETADRECPVSSRAWGPPGCLSWASSASCRAEIMSSRSTSWPSPGMVKATAAGETTGDRCPEPRTPPFRDSVVEPRAPTPGSVGKALPDESGVSPDSDVSAREEPCRPSEARDCVCSRALGCLMSFAFFFLLLFVSFSSSSSRSRSLRQQQVSTVMPMKVMVTKSAMTMAQPAKFLSISSPFGVVVAPGVVVVVVTVVISGSPTTGAFIAVTFTVPW